MNGKAVDLLNLIASVTEEEAQAVAVLCKGTALHRAIAIENNARENLLTIKGLGRSYAWQDFIKWWLDDGNKQIGLCPYYDDVDTPLRLLRRIH